MMLEIGTTAIDFTLPDEQGNLISLHSCAFKAAYDVYKRNDIIVIGISKDSSRSHLRFKEKYDLPFILLSDEEHKVIEAYDVWKEKKLYSKTYMGITRSTYVIDEEGTIIKTFEKANPATNAQDILEYLAQLSNEQ